MQHQKPAPPAAVERAPGPEGPAALTVGLDAAAVDRDRQIADAVGYLRFSFNPEVGLIFQSKEPGFMM